MIRARPPLWLDVSFYAVVIVMGGLSLAAIDGIAIQFLVVAVCSAFGVLYTIVYRTQRIEQWGWFYFVTQTIAVMILLALPTRSYDSQNFLLFIVGMQAVTVLPERSSVLWIMVLIIITSAATVFHSGLRGQAVVPLAFNAVIFLLVGAFGQAWRDTEVARRHNEQLVDKLKEAKEQVRDLAVAEERNRLAREVHDSIGHRLTVAVVQLEGAQRLIPTVPERAAGIVGTVRQQMKEGLAELRQTVSALRGVRDEVGEIPLDEALRRMVIAFEDSTGLAVHLTLPAAVPIIPAEQRLALFRAAQEALTNVQRHAAAHHVWLMLTATDERLTITASDDGRGWEPGSAEASSGFGLRGLHERVRELGGELTLAERPGGGAQVQVSVPLQDKGGRR
ncbi:MAG: sensor histidine kinase [Chloroflexi bacterium]|nr:sensor histidine kinase [Chloroflexota bacterium]